MKDQSRPSFLGIGLTVSLIVLTAALVFVVAQAAQHERLISTSPSDIAALTGGTRRLLVASVVAMLAGLSSLFFLYRLSGQTMHVSAKDSASPAASNNSDERLNEAAIRGRETWRPAFLRAARLTAIGSLVRSLIHEINNQLAPVQGYAELLAENHELSAKDRRFAESIRRAASTALEELNDFGTGIRNWDSRERQPLAGAVEVALKTARAALPPTVALDISVEPDIMVAAPTADMVQAVLHLLIVAREISDAKDVHLELTGDTVSAESQNEFGSVMQDDARFMLWSDPHRPDRVQAQFGQLRPYLRYARLMLRCPGRGLKHNAVSAALNPLEAAAMPEGAAPFSLTILVAVAVEHSGAIVIDSQPNATTSISILLPLEIAAETAADVVDDSEMEPADVMVIHRSEVFGEQLAAKINATGLKAASSTSAELAFALLQEAPSHCQAVLIEAAMLGDDEAANWSRSLGPHCRMITLGDPKAQTSVRAEVWPAEPGAELLIRLTEELLLERQAVRQAN